MIRSSGSACHLECAPHRSPSAKHAPQPICQALGSLLDALHRMDPSMAIFDALAQRMRLCVRTCERVRVTLEVPELDPGDAAWYVLRGRPAGGTPHPIDPEAASVEEDQGNEIPNMPSFSSHDTVTT